jgi:hypothetical protein
MLFRVVSGNSWLHPAPAEWISRVPAARATQLRLPRTSGCLVRYGRLRPPAANGRDSRAGSESASAGEPIAHAHRRYHDNAYASGGEGCSAPNFGWCRVPCEQLCTTDVASAATGGRRPEIAVRRSGGARRIGTIGGCGVLRCTTMQMAGRGECFGTSDALECREGTLRRAVPTSSRASNRFGGGWRGSRGAGFVTPPRWTSETGVNGSGFGLFRQVVPRLGIVTSEEWSSDTFTEAETATGIIQRQEGRRRQRWRTAPREEESSVGRNPRSGFGTKQGRQARGGSKRREVAKT